MYAEIASKEAAMRFITARDLRNKTKKIWSDLNTEKELVVTLNGKPVALLLNIEDDRLEDELASVRRGRAVSAVNRLQMKSMRTGKHKITQHQIDSEIQKDRLERTK
jgi:hypothetical protein